MVMKSFIFCDIAPCSLLKISWHFGRTFRLHFQDLWISRATSVKADTKLRCSTDYKALYPRRQNSPLNGFWSFCKIYKRTRVCGDHY
jgi:hypothetical protein